MKCMYFRNFTTLFVKYSYHYFSSHGVYGSKVKKRNKHQYVNECHLISHHWSNSKSHWLLFSTSYKFEDRIFTPCRHYNLTGIDLRYTHRAWVACVMFKQQQFNYCIRNRGNELEARSCDSCGLGSRSIRSTHTETRKHSFSLVSYMRPWRSFQSGANHFFNPFLSNDCFKSNLVPRVLFPGFGKPGKKPPGDEVGLNPIKLPYSV